MNPKIKSQHYNHYSIRNEFSLCLTKFFIKIIININQIFFSYTHNTLLVDCLLARGSARPFATALSAHNRF